MKNILEAGVYSTRTPTSYDARNILETVFREHYSEDIPGEDNEYIKLADAQTGDGLKSNILSVYPNPTEGLFTVQYRIVNSTSSYLMIADLAEKKLQQIPLTSESTAIDLDFSKMPSTTYLIAITDGRSVFSMSKVVVLK